MCPWPRIQAALTDEWALNVTYRYDRGEPRVSYKKSVALRAKGEPAGDCIDCSQCVAVCPTGVDIRSGSQLACIQCGLCIDACTTVMQKLSRPTGLISYDNDLNVLRRMEGKPEAFSIVRPRTILYTVLIAAVSLLMLGTLATRHEVGVNVIHDRNPIFVRLTDGAIRNGYTVRVLNKELERRQFQLTIEGLERAEVGVVGATTDAAGKPRFEVGPDQTLELRLLVTTHQPLPAHASIPIVIRVTDTANGESAEAHDHFRGP
jgi:cytochrome c oxidase accessory protein FixG